MMIIKLYDAYMNIFTAEWWLMGEADYFIVTGKSGYGKSAGMRSLKRNVIYMASPHLPIDCNTSSYSSLEEIKQIWSGI